jgi:CHAT domain-containing protein
VNKALREAQLAIKSVADEGKGFDHPYYWAPFILTGNMQTRINTNHFH